MCVDWIDSRASLDDELAADLLAPLLLAFGLFLRHYSSCDCWLLFPKASAVFSPAVFRVQVQQLRFSQGCWSAPNSKAKSRMPKTHTDGNQSLKATMTDTRRRRWRRSAGGLLSASVRPAARRWLLVATAGPRARRPACACLAGSQSRPNPSAPPRLQPAAAFLRQRTAGARGVRASGNRTARGVKRRLTPAADDSRGRTFAPALVFSAIGVSRRRRGTRRLRLALRRDPLPPADPRRPPHRSPSQSRPRAGVPVKLLPPPPPPPPGLNDAHKARRASAPRWKSLCLGCG